ncbi:uncharacterized protein LOC107632672 [Arachis ipaensis]|uniref:uncharacterized protein LOC107632672 n=1 Tax=Arachis ipaensis TaxID=130454 RepID=UPI0007AEED44|nr:uncharacterized protein LOC107632672 [Arachis ipaensis]
MIQPQTHLNVADNSGARQLMCIRIIGAGNRRYASIGDIVVAVIKEAVPNMSLERSEVIRAVIVRTCKELKRSNGMIIQYDDNAAVVIVRILGGMEIVIISTSRGTMTDREARLERIGGEVLCYIW